MIPPAAIYLMGRVDLFKFKSENMATYKEATGKTIDEAFQEFHEANPRVYEWFKVYCRQLCKAQFDRGRRKLDLRISAKLVINRIRWEIATTDLLDSEKEQFKLNDAYQSRYARLFQDDFPSWAHIFETRKLRS